MTNYQLLAIFTIAITNLICYGSSSQCIFIGCACQREKIRCPLDPTPLSMFPKRRISMDRPPRNLTIDLSSNRLEMVPDDRFAELDVNVLNLSHNQLTRISPDAFRDLLRLSSLSLSHNRLRSLSMALFGPVNDSLEFLALGNNQLGEMETVRLSNVFARLSNLKRLELAANRLNDLPDLTHIERLFYLDLRGNLLESLVDPDTLENRLPTSLTELYLDENQFKHISENWFETLTNLRHLSLSNNQISAIAEKSFEKLVALTTVNLSGNMLKHIPSEIIYTLESLEVLDLSSQTHAIRRIDDYAFDRESHKKPLKRVLLHNNSISVIGKRAFCVRGSRRLYANIKEIDLSSNSGLTHIDACVLRQLARGYSEPIYTSKLKLYSRVVLSREAQRDHPESLIECSCEITKANKLLELDGFCRRSDFTSVIMNQFDCGDYAITNANQVNKLCASRAETECLPTAPLVEHSTLTDRPMTLSSSTAMTITTSTSTSTSTSTPMQSSVSEEQRTQYSTTTLPFFNTLSSNIDTSFNNFTNDFTNETNSTTSDLSSYNVDQQSNNTDQLILVDEDTKWNNKVVTSAISSLPSSSTSLKSSSSSIFDTLLFSSSSLYFYFYFVSFQIINISILFYN